PKHLHPDGSDNIATSFSSRTLQLEDPPLRPLFCFCSLLLFLPKLLDRASKRYGFTTAFRADDGHALPLDKGLIEHIAHPENRCGFRNDRKREIFCQRSLASYGAHISRLGEGTLQLAALHRVEALYVTPWMIGAERKSPLQPSKRNACAEWASAVAVRYSALTWSPPREP